jgi:hypothetical protein
LDASAFVKELRRDKEVRPSLSVGTVAAHPAKGAASLGKQEEKAVGLVLNLSEVSARTL